MFKHRFLIAAASICGLVQAGAYAASPVEASPGALEFFEKKIRPLLVDNCYNCHSANTNAKGGLRVDDHNGLLHGGNSGAAIVPGEPQKSLLLKAVSYEDDDLKMPPKKQLSAEQVADLSKWIKDGAAWPAEAAVPVGKEPAKYEKLRKEHWAWQPVRETKAPAVRNAGWVKSELDQFILAKLEEKNLAPVGDADKGTLLRRVTFDLTGLPPTPAEIDAFVADNSADAFEKVVDRLLASPAYGERWGRHWLDVARYGESTGSSRNVPYPHAWRYRDYVIDAFNKDKPYDRFIREQVAGDLLPASDQAARDEQIIATGFLALGVKDVNQRFKERFIMDNVDEQIDTVSRSILAVTVSCARCHDHKFDPVPTADYYGLAGIFTSTDLCAGVRNKMGGGGLDYYDSDLLIPIGANAKTPDPAEAKKIEEAKKNYEKAKAEWDAIRGTPKGLAKGPDGAPTQRPFRLKFEKARAEYMALNDPAAKGDVALGARDAKTPADTEIRIRGEAEKLGPVVPRSFLSAITYDGQPKLNPKQSGRLELAQWLSSEKNPMTARVLANRVWGHLFGEALVRSVDNFGVTGDVPSHPELLDFLARRVVADQWSVKKLIREIVLSHTYRLDSAESPAAVAVDPANRLLWRHAPRRLDAEEIRDATLAATGMLKTDRPQASIAKDLKVMELRNNGPEARRIGEQAQAQLHRSIYLPLLRGMVPTSLDVFDFAGQDMVTGSRDATTVPPQALYMLNDPFVRKTSLALAEKLLKQDGLDAHKRIVQAYRVTLGRAPTKEEIDRVSDFLLDYESAAREVLAQAPKAAPAVIAVAQAEIDPSDAGGAGNAAEPTPAVDAAAKADSVKSDLAQGAKKGNKRKGADAQGAVPPPNPDEMSQADEPVKEENVTPTNAKSAAWASFVQALIGSAEFRYLK